MRNIILFVVVFWIGFNTHRYMIENNKTFWEMFEIELPKKDNFIYIDNRLDVISDNVRKTYNESQKIIEKDNKKIIYNTNNGFEIRALGEVDDHILKYAANAVNRFYGYNCTIGNAFPISEEMYIKNNQRIIDADFTIDKLSGNRKVIYIVDKDKDLWTNGAYLRGYAEVNGNTVIAKGDKSFLKETLKHEIGHTLGLNHCDNLSCIMAINNDEYESGNFCNRCKQLLNLNLFSHNLK